MRSFSFLERFEVLRSYRTHHAIRHGRWASEMQVRKEVPLQYRQQLGAYSHCSSLPASSAASTCLCASLMVP